MQTSPTAPRTITREDGATIAYHSTPGKSSDHSIGVVFFGGSHSDMNGTKAVALEHWCQDQGRAYLRFDYTGHGQSSGAFEDGCISDWAADARFVLDRLTTGRQVLVGSSMGGWIMLMVAQARADRVVGLMGLAAAPDFTENLMWTVLSEAQRSELEIHGQISLPNDYDPDKPCILTKKFIDDGKANLILRDPLNIQVPVRLIQGLQDADVPWATALKIQEVLVTDDVEIQFVKRGDHRLSKAHDLVRLGRTLGSLLEDLEHS